VVLQPDKVARPVFVSFVAIGAHQPRTGSRYGVGVESDDFVHVDAQTTVASEKFQLFPRQVIFDVLSVVGTFPAGGCAVAQLQTVSSQRQRFHEPVKVKCVVRAAKLDAASGDHALASFRLLLGINWNRQVYRAGNNPSVLRQTPLTDITHRSLRMVPVHRVR